MKLFIVVCSLLYIGMPWQVLSQDTTCGIMWEPPIQLSPDTVDNYIPSMAIQGDTISITWWSTYLPFAYARSIDGGKTFEPLRFLAPDSIPQVNDCFIVTSGKRLHGFFHSNIKAQIYHIYSDDRGSTWSTPQRLLDSLQSANAGMYTALGDTIIIYNVWIRHGPGFTISTDGGITWVHRHQPIKAQAGYGLSIGMTPGTLHLVKGWLFDSAGVSSEFAIQYRKSSDLGVTWTDSIPLSTININHSEAVEPSLSVDSNGDSSTVFSAWKDGKNGWLTLVGCSILGRFSNDNGNSFKNEQRYDERPAGYATKTAVRGNTMAISWVDDLADGGGLKIRVSYDKGASWCPPYTLSPAVFADMAISSRAIHVVWEEGVFDSVWRYIIRYRRGVFLPTSVNELSERPNFFVLGQNYPNPFNPKTVISFKIQVSGFTTLKVYDLFGREMAALVNNKLEAGEHDVEWNAENAASGVYYYCLITSGHNGKTIMQTKKMLLLK